MKNLMLIVPNLCGGGQERIAALTSVLLESDYNIFFITFNNTEPKYEVSAKAKMIDLLVPADTNFFCKIVNVLKRVKHVRNIKRSYHIDFSISFGRTANIVNCLSKAADKVICSIRNSSKLETGQRNCINTLIYKMSDRILCVSEGQKNRILKFYPQISSKTYVVYNPCDIKTIEEKCIIDKEKCLKRNTLVSCGRLESIKCYKNLFNAIKKIREEIKDIHLIVIGEGRQEDELKKYLMDIELEEAVTFIGFTNNPFEIISYCKAFVFSSCSEGFPNVVVEALACGVPVISTDCLYGPREILSNNFNYGLKDRYSIEEFGILVPSFQNGGYMQEKEEIIYASAIKELLTNVELYKHLRDKASKRSKKFSIEAYRKRMCSIINSFN